MNQMSTQISAGAVQATMRALCGIFVPSVTFDSHLWPGIIPSRAKLKISLDAAACRLSTQEMNARTATTRKIFAPTSPRLPTRIAGIGSATSPATISSRFGAAST